MTTTELEKAYAALLKDPDLMALELITEQPNIFRILGLEHYEIRHSNFLAWLLNPHESHNLGLFFLNRFLQDILLDPRSKGISIIALGNLDASKIEVRREWRNIDLLVITENFVVAIENKIWSGEHSDQLNRYREIIEEEFSSMHCAYVFLSPHGNESSESDTYINYSYRTISIILKDIIDNKGKQLSDSVLSYISDYRTSIEQSIMKEDTSNTLARKLYINHQDLFEFIWRNKPDEWSDLSQKIQDKLTHRSWILGSLNVGFVRFLTPKIDPYILRYDRHNGWRNAESFLFEFDFYQGKRIQFRVTVSDSLGYKKYDAKIISILQELDGANTKLGEKWKTLFSENLAWDIKKKMRNWSENSEKTLNDFIDKCSAIVINVEDKILEHKDELLALKTEFESEHS